MVGQKRDLRSRAPGSPLDAAPAAPLTANDLIPLFQGALAFAVLALLLFRVGRLLHLGVPYEAVRKNHVRHIRRRGHGILMDSSRISGEERTHDKYACRTRALSPCAWLIPTRVEVAASMK